MKRWLDWLLGTGNKLPEARGPEIGIRRPPDIDVLTFDGSDISARRAAPGPSELEDLRSGEEIKVRPTSEHEQKFSGHLGINQLFQEDGLVDVPEFARELEDAESHGEISEPVHRADGNPSTGSPIEGARFVEMGVSQGLEGTEDTETQATAGINAIAGTAGKNEEDIRNPEIEFDEEWYLGSNPDVRASVERGAFRSGLEHYLIHGKNEGRKPVP